MNYFNLFLKFEEECPFIYNLNIIITLVVLPLLQLSGAREDPLKVNQIVHRGDKLGATNE